MSKTKKGMSSKEFKTRLLNTRISTLHAKIEADVTVRECLQSWREYYDQKYGPSPKQIKCPTCGTNKNYPRHSKDCTHMVYHCCNCHDDFLVTIEEYHKENELLRDYTSRIQDGENALREQKLKKNE